MVGQHAHLLNKIKIHIDRFGGILTHLFLDSVFSKARMRAQIHIDRFEDILTHLFLDSGFSKVRMRAHLQQHNELPTDCLLTWASPQTKLVHFHKSNYSTTKSDEFYFLL